jgi:hypothetical protein
MSKQDMNGRSDSDSNVPHCYSEAHFSGLTVNSFVHSYMYISSNVPSDSSTTVVHSSSVFSGSAAPSRFSAQVWRIAPNSVVQLVERYRFHQLHDATRVVTAA